MATNFLGALDWHVGEDDEVGFRLPRRRGHGHPQRPYHSPSQNRYGAAQARANRAAAFAMPDVAGVPGRDAALLPAAFPVASFAAANGTNIQVLQMSPQSPFRGQRLTSTTIRNGTSAGVTAPLISYLQIGMKPIITTVNAVPLEVFSQNAYDTNLLMPPTTPGVIYAMGLGLSAALTSTDTLVALVAIIGSAVL